MSVLLFALQVLGATLNMSREEEKKTGVNKLSESQKMALQEWIDANYDKKSEAAPPPSETPSPAQKQGKVTLSENLMNSRYLRLSDGSLWNIRPEDVPIVQGWITPAEIVVSASTNPFYSYKLTNQVSGSSVLARKADKLPPPGSPNLAPTQQ